MPRLRGKRGFGLLLLLLLGLWLGFRGLRGTCLHLLRVEQAHWGTLEEQLPLELVVAREEELMVAPASGRFLPLVQEGERVAAGTPVARIFSSKEGKPVELRASRAGQVFFRWDGLEGVLQPAHLEGWPLRDIKRLLATAQATSAPSQIQEGSPCLRLVDNLAPVHLYGLLPERDIPWQAGQEVSLRLTSGVLLQARVVGILEANPRAILLEVNPGREELVRDRVVKAQGILKTYRGVLLPAKALQEEEGGQKGVYILTERGPRWQGVKVIGQVGQEVAVEGINPGVEVIANPFWVRWVKPR